MPRQERTHEKKKHHLSAGRTVRRGCGGGAGTGPYRAAGRVRAAPPFDPAAQNGVPDVPEDTGYGQLDAQSYRFSAAGALTVRDGAVDIWLTDPADSTVWLKVRLLTEDGAVLGESGLLRPGQYVRSVTLTTVPEQTVPVILKIMAYEPDTYYSAGSVVLQTQLRVA